MKTWPKIKSAPLTQHTIDNGPQTAPRRPWYARAWAWLKEYAVVIVFFTYVMSFILFILATIFNQRESVIFLLFFLFCTVILIIMIKRDRRKQ
jgi:hypothetical protein